jgi:hypothetical protein
LAVARVTTACQARHANNVSGTDASKHSNATSVCANTGTRTPSTLSERLVEHRNEIPDMSDCATCDTLESMLVGDVGNGGTSINAIYGATAHVTMRHKLRVVTLPHRSRCRRRRIAQRTATCVRPLLLPTPTSAC